METDIGTTNAAQKQCPAWPKTGLALFRSATITGNAIDGQEEAPSHIDGPRTDYVGDSTGDEEPGTARQCIHGRWP